MTKRIGLPAAVFTVAVAACGDDDAAGEDA